MTTATRKPTAAALVLSRLTQTHSATTSDLAELFPASKNPTASAKRAARQLTAARFAFCEDDYEGRRTDRDNRGPQGTSRLVDALWVCNWEPRRLTVAQAADLVEHQKATGTHGATLAEESAPYRDVEDAEAGGRRAFENGTNCAPILDPATRAGLIGATDIGTRNDIAAAWTRGWTIANLAAPVPELEEV